MRTCLGRQKHNSSQQNILPTAPTLFFRNSHTVCGSNHKLTVLKTGTKRAATLSIGDFIAHTTVTHCKQCSQNYYVEDMRMLIPHQCHFGFDIIIYVGNALYIEKRSHDEIQCALKVKNVSISLREITFLGNKYITYLAIAHNESKSELKAHFDFQGGYILHLDGSCEGDSPHLFSSMDGLSDIVLHNVKMPTENKKYIIPFLETIKETYGDPIVIVGDMSKAIMGAADKVFPGTRYLVCHFHFLRDLGKDLFQLEYRNILRFLKTFRIRTVLRKCIRELKLLIDGNDNLNQSLTSYLSRKNLEEYDFDLPSVVAAYILLAWVIEANAESCGFGFPFDRPHVDFVRRLKQAYPQLKELNVTLKQGQSMTLPIRAISTVLNDVSLNNNFNAIEEKIIIFDELRALMRIAQVNKTGGLNSEGDDDIKTIETEVKLFRESEKMIQLEAAHFSYKRFIKQIDKYWENLFADSIEVRSSSGEVSIILPQRTNNSMEQLFRSVKKDDRKKSGTKSLRKEMKSMHPQRPLIKNLKNAGYLNIILNGKANLAERFADIDARLVQEEMKKEREIARKYHKGMAKIFRIPLLPEKLGIESTKKCLAA